MYMTLRSRLLFAVAGLLVAIAWHANAGTGDTRGHVYRVISGGAASVTGTTASTSYEAIVVGGSGAAVGIAASANTTVFAGNATIDPPVRLFLGTFEND